MSDDPSCFSVYRMDEKTNHFQPLRRIMRCGFLLFRLPGLTGLLTCDILSRAAKDAENIYIYVRRNILALIDIGMRAVLVQEEVRNHGEQV